MSRISAPFALLGFLLLQCSPAPEVDPWPAHAEAMVDSMSATLAAYQERFGARDRDSLQRFYAEDPEWKWAADGRFGIPSSDMIRSRLDRLAVYPYWHIAYVNTNIRPLAPGLALVSTEYRMSFEAVGGKRSVYDGALTMFWKHLPQGWKVVGGHSSARTAAPLGSALRGRQGDRPSDGSRAAGVPCRGGLRNPVPQPSTRPASALSQRSGCSVVASAAWMSLQ